MSQRPAVSEPLLPGSDSTEPCVDPTQGTRATTAMVLGIIAIAGGMLCYLPALCGPAALVIGLNGQGGEVPWCSTKSPRSTPGVTL
jgi:hypothetical protein